MAKLPLDPTEDEVVDPKKVGEFVSVWKTIALVALAILTSGTATIFTIGTDNIKHRDIDEILRTRDIVKHSELDEIMATRAPYLHDKQRIEDRFAAIEKRVDVLERTARDDFDKRIRDLEKLHP